MKKLLALLFVLALCLAFSGCNASEEAPYSCGHEQYLPLIALLENGEYNGAKTWINDTYGLTETEAPHAEAMPTVPEETVATEPKRTGTVEIELTPENFGEYFEIYHDCFFQENAFGDISAGMMPWGIRLKDAFQPYLKKADGIAAEIDVGFSIIEYEIDYDNRKINLIEGSGIPTDDRYTYVCDLAYNESTSSVDTQVAFLVPSATRQACRYPTEVTVLRAKGKLILTEYPDTVQSDNDMPSATKQPNETEEITISAENWNTYFEFAEVPAFSENAFGEVDTFNLYFQFRLKEEYLERIIPDNSNIAVEASYTYGHRYCTVDYEAQTYELRGYKDTGKSSNMGELSFHSDGGYYFADFGVNPEYNGSTIFAYSDFEVLRINGILCLSSD